MPIVDMIKNGNARLEMVTSPIQVPQYRTNATVLTRLCEGSANPPSSFAACVQGY